MRRSFSLVIALLAWFSVIAQYILMLNNRQAPVAETTIRFFSFFTILTNSLVAIFFSADTIGSKMTKRPGLLTALTSYILIVGLVYQFMLRHLWTPTGLQLAIDELLHSLIPFLVLLYWFLYETKQGQSYRRIPGWLLYPLVYFIYVLIRGSFSGFYPYPFINAAELGYPKTILNAGFILVFFVILQAALIKLSQVRGKAKN